jgi:hypothetical protein
MTPAGMPACKQVRPVQGRYSALVRKWSDGVWKCDKGGAQDVN